MARFEIVKVSDSSIAETATNKAEAIAKANRLSEATGTQYQVNELVSKKVHVTKALKVADFDF